MPPYSLTIASIKLILDGIVQRQSDHVDDITSQKRWIDALTDAASAAFSEEKVVGFHY